MKTKTWENIAYICSAVFFIIYLPYEIIIWTQYLISLGRPMSSVIPLYITMGIFILIGLFSLYLLKINNEKEKEQIEENKTNENQNETNESSNNP